MNGSQIVLTVNNVNTAFQMDEGSTGSKTVAYSINDPTVYTNVICVVQQ